MFDAVIFDLDGTLIDTESTALTAGLAAFSALDQAVDLDFMHQLVGVDLPSAAARIIAHRPKVDMDRLNAMWRKGFDDAIAIDMPLKPYVQELLAALKLPKAICTSTGRDGAHHKLQLAGIAAHFSHVITVDDVTRPKPAPEPYLLTAAKLGVDPARCVVFEDSETGAAAAHAAGCRVVQVPDLVPSSGRFAHHVAPDLMAGAQMAGLL